MIAFIVAFAPLDNQIEAFQLHTGYVRVKEGNEGQLPTVLLHFFCFAAANAKCNFESEF